MKQSLLLLVPVLLVTLLFSCKKDNEGELNTVTPGGYRSLEEAIASAAPISKSTSLNVPAGDTFVAPGGTVIIFPPNAFETLSGGKVTGSVQITFQDWLKKGDMVFGKVLPLTYGAPLVSAGEAFIHITQNGQVLRMKRGVYGMVKFPQFGAPISTMTGWVGRTQIGSANTVNWISADTLLKPDNLLTDTVTVRLDTLHYIQAAVPLPAGPTASFTVKLNSPVVLESSMSVALYDSYKSVYPLTSVENGQVNAQKLPGSGPVHVAVMGINKGKFYGGIVAVPLPANDSIYTVIIKGVEPANFKLQLNSL